MHCPSQSQDTEFTEMDEWRGKMCTTLIAEYYPATEKNKIPSAVAKWVGLEDTV